MIFRTAVGVAAWIVQSRDRTTHDLEMVAYQHKQRFELVFVAGQVLEELQAAEQRTQRAAAYVVHGLGEFLAGSLGMRGVAEFADAIDERAQVVPLRPARHVLPLPGIVGGGVRDGVKQLPESLVDLKHQRLVADDQACQRNAKIIALVALFALVGQMPRCQRQK